MRIRPILAFNGDVSGLLGDEISALKKQLPSLGSFKTIQEALDSGEMNDQEAKLKAALASGKGDSGSHCRAQGACFSGKS